MNKIHLFLFSLLFLLAGCKGNTAQSAEAQSPNQDETQSEAQVETFLASGANTTGGQAAQTGLAKSSRTVNLLKQHVGRGVSDIILERKGYVTSYNKQRKNPNWVAWTLTRQHTYGDNQRQNERFEEDPDVPQPRATFQDYYNSRYDRGHMCPAGDNKWDGEAMRQSFLMTNICPQNHGLNKEDWNNLEMQCRTWARRYGEVTIVCGPLYEGEERFIGRNRVQVPSGFFKVVYREKPQKKAIGFIFRNNGNRQPWREQACSVDDVEERTGFDFFPQLPDDTEDLIEAEELLRDW